MPVSRGLRLGAAILIASLPLAVAATDADSGLQRYSGAAWVSVTGWGSVKLEKGIRGGRTIHCELAKCPAASYLTRGRRAVLVEKAYPGWRFSRWTGSCRSRKARCSVDLARLHPNVYGLRQIHVRAEFVPVAAGLTPGRPIALGTAAPVAGSWRVRVDSVARNVQLSPAAPAGDEYLGAEVTITNEGHGSASPEQDLTWKTRGGNKTYSTGSDPCPQPGPQPALPTYDPVLSGHSVTGYVCWRVAARDANELELYLGSGSVDYPGTTWFALH